MTIDRVALPSVRSFGSRPAWNQIAALMSMALPLESLVNSSCPAPVTNPAPVRTMMCQQGGACDAPWSRSIPGPPQIACCTSSSNFVSAAAARPVPIPVSTTASQKPA
jgi:hypothetical protein